MARPNLPCSAKGFDTRAPTVPGPRWFFRSKGQCQPVNLSRHGKTGRGELAAWAVVVLATALVAKPAFARDNLGVYGNWGAFRDPGVPRCYAIAMAEPSQLQREFQPYAAIGSWPKRGERGQVHFRLSRSLANPARVSLSLSGQKFDLAAGGADAWAADRRMDAAIVAAMRSAAEMTVHARDAKGRSFSNSYKLDGVATAMDAALLGCARLR